jgi:hypothetical protein
MSFFPLMFFYILDLLRKMPTKVQFIRKVHNNIQMDQKKKNWKGVKQITRYKQTKKTILKWNLIYD